MKLMLVGDDGVVISSHAIKAKKNRIGWIDSTLVELAEYVNLCTCRGDLFKQGVHSSACPYLNREEES